MIMHVRRIALSALVLVAGCGKSDPPPAPSPAASDLEAKSAPTPWVKARAPEKLSMLEAPAEVLPPPGAKGAVVPPFSARVVKVHVREGERVEKDAAVTDVVMPELVRAAGALSAAGTRQRAQSKRKAQLEALKAEGLTRMSELAEVEGAVADASAEAQIALATLKIAGMGAKDASALLASGGVVTLKSPVAGVVVHIDAPIGETRDPSGEPLARVVGEGAPRVEARFSNRPPAGAGFSFVGPSGHTFALKLVGEAPATSGRDGTIPAWFEPTEPMPLPHGTLGKVRVAPDPKSKLLAVPAAAVALKDGQAHLFVRKRKEPLPVKVIVTSGADALVEGALAEGDEVAADAARALGASAEDAP